MVWATSGSAIDMGVKDGDIIAVGLLASTTVYKGDIVRSTGSAADVRTYCSSVAAVADYDQFIGVAIETVVASAVNNASQVRVSRKKGSIHKFYKATPAYTDMGAIAYLDVSTDPQTVVTTAGTHAIAVGIIVGWDATAGTVDVAINPDTIEVAA